MIFMDVIQGALRYLFIKNNIWVKKLNFIPKKKENELFLKLKYI